MRRGETGITTLVAIVLGIGFLLVALSIGLLFREKVDSSLEKSSCAVDIIAHHSLAELTREYTNIQIACPTRVVSAKGSDEQVKRRIAQEMAICWSQWGEGEYLLFGDQKATYCHICATIDTPGRKSLVGLPAYLESTKYYGTTTYAEYLSGERMGDYFDGTQFATHANDAIYTDDGLGVIFYYAKGESDWDQFVRFTAGNPIFMATAGGLAVGTITVASGGGALPVITLSLGGATASGFTSFTLRPEQMSHLSVVVVRPMTPEAIRDLKCTRTPVAEK